MSTCLTCGGEGIIITCCDDICVGSGHCIHGDGEEYCPDCEGEGFIDDDSDDGGYSAYLDNNHPDEFYEPSEEEERRIVDEEYEHNHGICGTCGGEWGEGWTSCICDEEIEPQTAA